ncbi:radical SAM protein [Aquimarina sp. MMG016]|uniref:radical SAM protein n=1 Tax=Aquimarina sp. MMG016 TaxID=2822690 RepID=UPI001B39EDC7|nr:radical SAM protein [Aquimarina sp. MMG016]MBQ4822098.1 radical SAM protein [Aquimarina sp. MMG016]
MGVELRPLGVKCNIACQYCYQHPQRDVEESTKPYDMDKMKEAILQEGGDFTLFGGEALLVPIEDLEELWSWGLEQFGSNSVQTNGSLITDAHIAMFKKYKVNVGLSIDGPGDLNDVRWAGNLERTRKLTQQSEDAIAQLAKEGLKPSIIITLHRGNVGTAEKRKRMGAWIKELDQIGVRAARLHLMEVESESIRAIYHLTEKENTETLLYFHQLESELKQLRFDIFSEIESLLKADDHGLSCVWKACDPYTTSAVRGVEGNGQRSNCGRTNKEGIDFVKSGLPSYARYISLYHTPQEHGGCNGCRFFAMCKGHCPGTSLEGDWRNRTEHCNVWKTLFELTEERMIAEGEVPLSTHGILPFVEQKLIEGWSQGINPSIQSLIAQAAQQQKVS